MHLAQGRTKDTGLLALAIVAGLLQAQLTFAPNGAPPANDDCANAMQAFDGDNPFTTIGATTDGPAHPECLFCCGDDQVNQDIWFRYESALTDVLTVTLCLSDFDTKVAMYEGCECPVSDANLLACNDDSCGLQSLLSANVISGQCYLIRIGGFLNEEGTGHLSIAMPTGDPCTSTDHDCCVTGSPGCTDKNCCDSVCPFDPFCCDVMWDANCVLQAQEVCTNPPLGCTPCIGELTGDAAINTDELLLVINSWGPCQYCMADINGDDGVNVDDLLLVINHWGHCE